MDSLLQSTTAEDSWLASEIVWWAWKGKCQCEWRPSFENEEAVGYSLMTLTDFLITSLLLYRLHVVMSVGLRRKGKEMASDVCECVHVCSYISSH